MAINGSANTNLPAPFLTKTYEMVDESATDPIVSWGSNDNTFVVWNPPEFSKELLPKFFKHNNFSSFIRQLNTYGFRKAHPDRWEFTNEGFVRGKRELLKNIHRRKPVSSPLASDININGVVQGYLKEGNPGLLGEVVEMLKQEKGSLIMEILRLRKNQQETENEICTLAQRVQSMEQRQQAMVSFFTEAMRNPGLLSHLADPGVLFPPMKKRPRTELLISEELPKETQIVQYHKSFSNDNLRDTAVELYSSEILEEPNSNPPPQEIPAKSTDSVEKFPPNHTTADELKSLEAKKGARELEIRFIRGSLSKEIKGAINVRNEMHEVGNSLGVNDGFWEQFLTESPGSSDATVEYGNKSSHNSRSGSVHNQEAASQGSSN